MMAKIIVLVLLLIIIGSLASGLVFLVKDKGKSDRAVKALTWRIGLSLLAFAILMIGAATGYLRPHSLLPPQSTTLQE